MITGRTLAPYAAHESHSRGRRVAEPPPRDRSEYQRDRDRVIHSTAFRRLEYKTQVFVNHEGDLFRTRLTHSLEVAQIARSVSRSLELNEDLTEALALAHDLGHTPFGHTGQDALNDCMAPYGGFEHNLQSLRTVDELEQRYAAFDGLNLTFECREGILKRCSRDQAICLGEVAHRFVAGGQPSLEAQITNLADQVAYNNHDVDDGLRAGLITEDELRELELFRQCYDEVRRAHPQLTGRRVVHEVVRRMIDALVVDLVTTTAARIRDAAPADIDAVRARADPLVGFSAAMETANRALKAFLHERLYRHYRVHRMATKAARVVVALFHAFLEDPNLMPPEHCHRARDGSGDAARARAVADYIAGMTDRFAIAEHRRLFDPKELT